jgi:hypothetical protein
VELQAQHLLSRMLGRVRLAAGDRLAIHLTVSTPSGELVAIDRAEIKSIPSRCEK